LGPPDRRGTQDVVECFFAFLPQICDRRPTRFLIIEDLSDTAALEPTATESA
jgi:hypothetical protein